MKYDKDGDLIPDELQDVYPSIELITPEKANRFLQKMVRNRRIRKAQLNKYKNDLRNGTFKFCTAPIVFDKNGEMTDGQHRCRAVVDTGVSFWGFVLYNVPSGAVIDKGAMRTTGEALYMQGILDEEMSKKQYISIIRCYLRCKYKTRGEQATDAEIGDFCNKYQEELFTALSLSCMNRNGTRCLCRVASVQTALFAALCNGEDVLRLEEFTKIVNSGFADGKKDSAAIVLRNYLINFPGVHGAQEVDLRAAYTENAIYDFVHERPRTNRYRSPKHVYIDKCDASM